MTLTSSPSKTELIASLEHRSNKASLNVQRGFQQWQETVYCTLAVIQVRGDGGFGQVIRNMGSQEKGPQSQHILKWAQQEQLMDWIHRAKERKESRMKLGFWPE